MTFRSLPVAGRRVIFAAVAGILATGCNQAAGPDPAKLTAWREHFVLAAEPDEVQTVLEVRRKMYGLPEPSEEPHDHDHAEAAGGEDDHEHAEHEHESDQSDDEQEHESAEAEHDHEHGDEAEHAEHEHGAGETHAFDRDPVLAELPVTVVGTVGGVPNPSTQTQPEFPFVRGQAMFFLADPEASAEVAAHAHEHAPGEECAFCAAHAEDLAYALAAVQFKTDDGKLVPAGVHDLFDLHEKDTVVVTGIARATAGGMLTIDATGVYVRR